MQEIFQWVENIAFYSLLLVLVVHILPAGEQKKYVQFFMGLVFMILVFSPILNRTGQEEKVTRRFVRAAYDQEVEEFLQEQRRLEKEMEDYTWQVLEKAAEKNGKDGGAEEYEGAESQKSKREQAEDRMVEPVRIRVEAAEGNPS